MLALLVNMVVLLAAVAGSGADTPVAPGQDQQSPGTIVMDQMALHYGPVVFDHALHADMSPMAGGCSNCHHDIGREGLVAPCRNCHSPTPSADAVIRPGLKGAYHRQCLSCHRDWAHENACGFCHEDASHEMPRQTSPDTLTGSMPSSHHLSTAETFTYQTSYEPIPVVTFHHEDHARVFGLDCVDCHQGASCDTCHGPQPTVRTVVHEEMCFACHANKRCTFCHGLGEHRRFDHVQTTGWSLMPKHADVPCAGCHGPDPALEPPPSESCRACHRASADGDFDHASVGVPLEGDHAYFECVACHHGRVEGGTATCTDCHADMDYPDAIPGRFTHPQIESQTGETVPGS